MTTGVALWGCGLILLVAYIVQVTMREPRSTRTALASYWFLFIIVPLIAFGAVFHFSTLSFALGFLVLLLLTVVGERGLRWWSRLFGAP